VEPALADLDYGAWHGRSLIELASESPDDVAAWTRDPDAAPHGGESFAQLVVRIGHWLESPEGVLNTQGVTDATGTSGASGQAQHVVAITHAAVMRAAIVHALGASPAAFTRIEIAPLSAIELRHSRRGWSWWPAQP
jgi:broad specificity phosphatase PhoE